MARDPGRLGCAAEALARNEPMVGTASRVRRWLVIEQPGSWGRSALLESRMAAPVAEAIDAHARTHDVRVLLARRLDADRSGPRTAFLVRSDRVHRWIERVTFDDPADLVDIDLALLGADEAPGVGQPAPANLPLVCTNGKHDPCCADFGRPVVRALRDADVEVWESSHVGGDRFAANLVCLPTGVYFGRVQPEEAAGLLADLEDGLLDLDRYRGRSCYPPLMQAAEIFTRRELGERRLDALHFVSATGSSTEALVVLTHSDGREARVQVVRERGVPEALTCASLDQSPPWHQRLVSIEISPPSAPGS
jgi:hypothetical protein